MEWHISIQDTTHPMFSLQIIQHIMQKLANLLWLILYHYTTQDAEDGLTLQFNRKIKTKLC